MSENGNKLKNRSGPGLRKSLFRVAGGSSIIYMPSVPMLSRLECRNHCSWECWDRHLSKE